MIPSVDRKSAPLTADNLIISVLPRPLHRSDMDAVWTESLW